ncbi:MAG: hypothetical protein IKZ21_07985, partial [Clostridia bacterium]|nr:hypothetical protein [Clostridia bacterium]
MMKKILSLVLATLLLLTLAACGGSGAGSDNKPASGLTVGFGRVNITPEYPAPLNGYGDEKNRLSTGYIDYLYAT